MLGFERPSVKLQSCFISTLTHQQKMQKKGGMGKNLSFNEEIN